MRKNKIVVVVVLVLLKTFFVKAQKGKNSACQFKNIPRLRLIFL